MFKKEFANVVSQTGMVPLKDLRPLLDDKDPFSIGELNLLKFSFFDDLKFAKMVAQKYGLTFIDLSGAKVDESVLGLIKKSDVIKTRCVPIQKTSRAVVIASFDPSVANIKADLQKLYNHPVNIIITSISAWDKLFNLVPEKVDELLGSIEEVSSADTAPDPQLKEEDIGADVVDYVYKVLAEAFARKASDIHFEPYERIFRVRLRIDGELNVYDEPGMNMMLPVLSRLKIMSQMDISERRKPQDGRIKLRILGKEIDYRVSSLPTLFGEKVVLRLLDKSNLQLDMTKLGFEPRQLEGFLRAIYAPFGMCLVTGPTGSGKTTTLYSALAELNKISSNISTAEDPVEFNLMGINQVNVRKDIGFTFATALKAFLRQDPDIIMVGEIRDLEVGEIAIEAALTGHLVLSTLHTNDAAATITRLLNMGIENFLVSSSLNVVVAQRLCRKVCENCKKIENIPVEQLVQIGISKESAEKMKIYKGEGCKSCGNTGYKGRIAIYEVLEITPAIKELIMKNATSDQIKIQAIKEGMKTLRMAALTKVALGQTTIEEALSNTGADKLAA
jgi:type IV pilus assembly protein PilB